MMRVVALFFCLSLAAPVQAFLVSDISGNRVDVSESMGDGRWTIVMIWQLECALCELQKPAVEAFHEKHQSHSAHVLGLVLDGHEYLPAINDFVSEKPTAFPSLVVFGDVFNQQIMQETGKHFPTAPAYIVYSPEGEMKLAINNRIEIDELLAYIETELSNKE